jgi:hypothetical protein
MSVVVPQQRVRGTAQHPPRHESHTVAMDAERPDLFPTALHALLIRPLRDRVTWVLLADGVA